MVVFQAAQGFFERSGHRRNRLHFFRRQIVDVLVERLARVHFVLDAVQTRHQHGSERKVRIGCRVRRPELDALGFRVRGVHGNAARRRAVPPRVCQVYRRFIARHQPLVAVGGGSDDRRQRPRMLQQPADVVQSQLAEAGVAVAREQRLTAFPQALMHMHAAAVIRKQGLRHKRHRLAVLVGHVANHILVNHHVVGGFHQLVEALVDFRLAAGGHFVMVALDVQTAGNHGLHHLAAQILVVIGGRHREVPFLVPRPVSQVVLPPAGVPAPFLGIDEVEAGVLVLVETHVIENEEFGFRAEVRCVGNAAVLQVQFGFLADPARIALVALLGDRVLHVPSHY